MAIDKTTKAAPEGRTPKVKCAKLAPDIRKLPLSRKFPLIEDGMRIDGDVLALGINDRPMVWSDLPLFEAKHGRSAHDMVYDLGMHQANHYRSRVGLHEILPFDVELLVRLYDRYPSSCLWECPPLQDMFFRIYGQSIDGFAQPLQDRARNAYGMRFARMMGRAPTVQYRWLWGTAMQDKSGSTRRVSNIISKLYEASLSGQHPREVLEGIAVHMWALRGLNVDAETPAHDPISLQKISQKISKKSDRATNKMGAQRGAQKAGQFSDAPQSIGSSNAPKSNRRAAATGGQRLIAKRQMAAPVYEGGAFVLGED